LFNLPGNIISGRVTGDTAKQLSDRIGKILQNKQSVSINSQDTSSSHSQQMDLAVPPSKIGALSSGEFVGMVADTPSTKIQLKAFHAEIITDFKAIEKEEAGFVDIPVIRKVTPEDIEDVFLTIKEDIIDLVDGMLTQMQADPELSQLIVNKALPEKDE
jgi:predicted secreted protein